MFTGLIESTGRIAGRRPAADGMRLEIESAQTLDALQLGESIAVDGVCLTVVNHRDDRRFDVDVSSESVRSSTLGEFAIGRQVNLERALRLGDRLGGHLVSGHVDGQGTLVSRRYAGESVRLRFSAPAAILAYFVPKGSVAVNGVSLTINELDSESFEVNVIPHTLAETSLEDLRIGASANLEVDMLAKMVQRLLGVYQPGGASQQPGDISLDLLGRSGFIKAPSRGSGGRGRS